MQTETDDFLEFLQGLTEFNIDVGALPSKNKGIAIQRTAGGRDTLYKDKGSWNSVVFAVNSKSDDQKEAEEMLLELHHKIRVFEFSGKIQNIQANSLPVFLGQKEMSVTFLLAVCVFSFRKETQ